MLSQMQRHKYGSLVQHLDLHQAVICNTALPFQNHTCLSDAQLTVAAPATLHRLQGLVLQLGTIMP